MVNCDLLGILIMIGIRKSFPKVMIQMCVCVCVWMYRQGGRARFE